MSSFNSDRIIDCVVECQKFPSNQQYRVLLINFDPAVYEFVAGMLDFEHIDLLSVQLDHQTLTMARQTQPDLILLNFELPNADGLRVSQQLRNDPVLASIPLIYCMSNDSFSIHFADLHGGGVDYIRKPFCVAEVQARVRSALDRKRMLDQLARLTLRDTLTGLLNRESIRSRIQSAIDDNRGDNSAVLVLDIDRFKSVNNSLGHDIGDELLVQIAHRLRSGDAFSGDQTAVARLSGDEFVVLLEGLSNPADALLVADRLLATMAEPYGLARHQVYCTASVGVVNSLRSYATSGEVLRDAATAMHAAKSAGKARFVQFDTTLHDHAVQRLKLEHDLRLAIGNQELFLAYQPIVSLDTGRTVAFESLIRWRHPERGLIVPSEFLPTAVETGLIVDIGTFVLDKACQELACWQRSIKDAQHLQIHVNFSRKQLFGDIAGIVRRTLEKHAISPRASGN